MTIAQVQVDEAYWTFIAGSARRPCSACDRLDPHSVSLGPWRSAHGPARHQDRHDLRARDPCCRRDPGGALNQLLPQALLGAFVGILPVAIGLMFYPALRGLGRQGMVSSRPYGRAARVPACGPIEDAFELAGRRGRRLSRPCDGGARRGAFSCCGLSAAAGARRPGWRWRPSSPSGSACTISVKALPSAPPSRPEPQALAHSSCSALLFTTLPKASALPHRC